MTLPLFRIKRSRLSDGIEREIARVGARWLFTGCLLLGAVDATARTITVNTTGDPGPEGSTSLRSALASAQQSAGNIVTFDPSLRDSTITLTQGTIVTGGSYAVYIEGPGSGHLTIDGNGSSGVFAFLGTNNNHPTFNLSGLTITHGHQRHGQPTPGGGGIEAKYVTLGLNDVVITGCSADDYGGGVLIAGGPLAMTHSTITGNSAMKGGGGINAEYFPNGGNSLYVTDSTVSNNTTYGYGAGIFAASATRVQITRSLITGNTIPPPYRGGASGGGGIAAKAVSQQILVVNSTIANNYSYGAGGGMDLLDAGSAAVTQLNFATVTGNYSGFGFGANGIHDVSAATAFGVSNSIIANNFNRYGNVDIDGTVVVNHSLIRNVGAALISGGNNRFDIDPKLGPLAFNGGPTKTYLPLTGSPVIDMAGDPGTLTKDQRGLPRRVGVASDMGAVERQTVEDEIFRDGFDPG